jgi:hypothetical protein
MPTAAEQDTYYQAINILDAECMARFGLPDPSPIFIGSARSPMYRRYGVTSMAVARRWGYHLDKANQDVPPAPPSMPAPERAAAFAVLLGTWSKDPDPHLSPLQYPRIRVAGKLVPAGGCRTWAALRLGSSHHEVSTLPEMINLASFEASQSNPKVVAAFRAWSKCMAAHGYTASDPLNIHTPVPPSSGAGSGGPSQAEIRTAVADVTCKNRTLLVAIWFGAEYRYQEAAIQRHFTVLSALRAYLLRQQRAALAVIASGH